MSRDLVLGGLVICVGGSLILAFGQLALPRVAPARRSGIALERATWLRLWMPIVPALVAIALLVGWAVQEPAETDELLAPSSLAFLVPLSILWMRGAWRSVRAWRGGRRGHPAMTVGLLRPRVIVEPCLRRVLDEACLRATYAHEEAHRRHRDPLRLWLAQAATDLQWPSHAAHDRLNDWRAALEMARDEQARRDDGARGEDLAAAILVAARIGSSTTTGAVATLTDAERNLVIRLDRLLGPLTPLAPQRRWSLLLVFGVVIAGALGWVHGDDIVRALPVVRVSPIVDTTGVVTRHASYDKNRNRN